MSDPQADERTILLQDEVDLLKQSLADCSKEYHAAINEPEYAGTRQDWIWRAQKAEAKVQDLEREVQRLKDLLAPRDHGEA